MSASGWIGCDLDGTLAHYDPNVGIAAVGQPIGVMLARVKEWLARGIDVRIVTARVGHDLPESERREQTRMIREWCLKHLGVILGVTCCKDFGMVEIWDDRAVQVIPNTGLPIRTIVDRRRFAGGEVQ